MIVSRANQHFAADRLRVPPERITPIRAEEAAEPGKQIRAGLVIPCHYEIFGFNTVSTDLFVKPAEQLRQKYRLLKCGERLDM
jgi:hypothetical protein